MLRIYGVEVGKGISYSSVKCSKFMVFYLRKTDTEEYAKDCRKRLEEQTE